MRSSAHDGLNPRLAWWEWCAEWGDNIDDQALWSRVNPACPQAACRCRPLLMTERFCRRISSAPAAGEPCGDGGGDPLEVRDDEPDEEKQGQQLTHSQSPLGLTPPLARSHQ